jgi:hypothetical protein
MVRGKTTRVWATRSCCETLAWSGALDTFTHAHVRTVFGSRGSVILHSAMSPLTWIPSHDVRSSSITNFQCLGDIASSLLTWPTLTSRARSFYTPSWSRRALISFWSFDIFSVVIPPSPAEQDNSSVTVRRSSKILQRSLFYAQASWSGLIVIQGIASG